MQILICESVISYGGHEKDGRRASRNSILQEVIFWTWVLIAKDKVEYLKPRGYQPEVQSVTKQRELKAPLRVPKLAGMAAEDAESVGIGRGKQS